jgi:Lsr2
VFFAERRFAFTVNPFSMKGKPVAQKVQVLLVDDLDGGEADETVTFALDGVTYEIDLTTENADKLRGLLSPYTDSGRRTGGRAGRGRTRAVRGNGGGAGPDTAKIRAWAKEKGYEVNDRGRVPATIREAYEKAHG